MDFCCCIIVKSVGEYINELTNPEVAASVAFFPMPIFSFSDDIFFTDEARGKERQFSLEAHVWRGVGDRGFFLVLGELWSASGLRFEVHPFDYDVC